MFQDFTPADDVEELNPTLEQEEVRRSLAAFLQDETTNQQSDENLAGQLQDFIDEGPRINYSDDSDEIDSEVEGNLHSAQGEFTEDDEEGSDAGVEVMESPKVSRPAKRANPFGSRHRSREVRRAKRLTFSDDDNSDN